MSDVPPISDALYFRTIIRDAQMASLRLNHIHRPWQWQCLTCYKHYEGYPGQERCEVCQIIYDRERRQRLREQFANRH